MSISSEIRRAGPFAGNGSTVNFPFTFKVFNTAQVLVTRTVSGVETVLTLTTDYTVSLNSNQDTSPGGTVTMLVAPATGQSITITSNVANLQPTVLANLGGFYPEVINDSLDRATIQIQQLDERVDRALTIPVSSSGIDTELPVPESGKLIGWDGLGTGLQNYSNLPTGPTVYQYVHQLIATAGQTVVGLPVNYTLGANAITVFVNGLRVEPGSGLDYVETNTTTITFNSGLSAGDLVVVAIHGNISTGILTLAPVLGAVSSLNFASGDYIEATGASTFRARKLTVATYAALTAIPAASRHDDMLVYVASRSADGDGGEGYWRFDAGSSATANGGTILAPDAGSGRWFRQYSGAVNVLWFGAKGDGVTDDTAAIQAALDSGVKKIVCPGGKTFLIDGGLTLSSSNTTLVASGATIKLKDNASSLAMLYISATDCVVDGGTWDGNKSNGNIGTWGSEQFDSYNIAMYADRCTVKNIRSINTWGMAIKGFGNYLSVFDCRISGTQNYGIFFDGNTLVSHTGNRAIGNSIDMSDGQIVSSENQGQGILFTAGAGQNQTNWELSGNYIIGPQTSVTDQAINLAVRGQDGVVTNNTTRYGAMGFSEGGDNCSITGNCFLELRGTIRYGIEPSGKFSATDNIITDAYVGIDCNSASKSYDESCITSNVISVAGGGLVGIGIRLQIAAAQTGQNVVISNNTITTSQNGIYLLRDCAGTIISNNTIIGPGVGSGRGVYLDTVSTAAFISIVNNVFRDFLRPWSVYSLTAITFTDLYAAHNMCINVGSSGQRSWLTEGSAAIGARAAVLGASFGTRNLIDTANNIFYEVGSSYNNPNGLLTAGVGSIHVSTNSNGGIYRKNTGTGNTGWVRLDLAQTETAANIASVAASINTTGKYGGQLVWDTTNTRMMRASGSAAADPWVVIDGSASVTPS